MGPGGLESRSSDVAWRTCAERIVARGAARFKPPSVCPRPASEALTPPGRIGYNPRRCAVRGRYRDRRADDRAQDAEIDGAGSKGPI